MLKVDCLADAGDWLRDRREYTLYKIMRTGVKLDAGEENCMRRAMVKF